MNLPRRRELLAAVLYRVGVAHAVGWVRRTALMPLYSVTTIVMNPRHPEEQSAEQAPTEIDLSEDEIEGAIAEIQAALKKGPRQ